MLCWSPLLSEFSNFSPSRSHSLPRLCLYCDLSSPSIFPLIFAFSIDLSCLLSLLSSCPAISLTEHLHLPLPLSFPQVRTHSLSLSLLGHLGVPLSLFFLSLCRSFPSSFCLSFVSSRNLTSSRSFDSSLTLPKFLSLVALSQFPVLSLFSAVSRSLPLPFFLFLSYSHDISLSLSFPVSNPRFRVLSLWLDSSLRPNSHNSFNWNQLRTIRTKFACWIWTIRINSHKIAIINLYLL